MKGINYMAAMGTVLIFASVYSCKAAFYKKKFKEELQTGGDPLKKSSKILLLFLSVVFLTLGLLLILKSLKLI